MNLFYTSFFGALWCFLIFLLGLNISRLRIKEKISLGDGGKRIMQDAIRAHGNALEHILPVLILFGIYEFHGASAEILLGIGSLFTFLRFFHVWGMIFHAINLRRFAAFGTIILEFLLCLLIFQQLLNV